MPKLKTQRFRNFIHKIVTPLQVADVYVTKTDSVDPVFLDHDYSYTLTIGNDGPDNATNVVTTDTLPSSFKHISATSTKGTCTGTTVIACSIGTLNNGERATITHIVEAVAEGTAVNSVSVTLTEYDPNPSNSTDVLASVTILAALSPNTGLQKMSQLGLYASLFIGISLLLLTIIRTNILARQNKK